MERDATDSFKVIHVPHFFTLQTANILQHKYHIVLDTNSLPMKLSDAAAAILPARLLGCSYDIYLRIMRDVFLADIVRSDDNIDIYVTRTNDINRLVYLLNSRLLLALMYYNSPNLEQRIQELENKRYDE